MNEIFASAATLGASGVVSAIAMKSPDLLKEIYGDLAKPGVQQVGKALSSVLQLGNNLLLPLRLINEVSREFEERKFEEIAKRFERIPVENIVNVSPEIGVPILEKLSYTEDEMLRSMFIEVLAKASAVDTVELAHPSFSNIIENISPDEAVILKYLFADITIPYLWVKKIQGLSGQFTILRDSIISTPDSILFPNNIPIYLSNLRGLGLISFHKDEHIADERAYDDIIGIANKMYSGIIIGNAIEVNMSRGVGEILAIRGLIRLEPFGRSFRKCCIG